MHILWPRRLQKAAFFLLTTALGLACARPGYQVASIRAGGEPMAGQPVTAAAATDSLAEQTIRPYRSRVMREMAEVIGQNPVGLTKPGGQGNQAALTRWVAQVLLTEAVRTGALPLPDFAALTNGSVRAGLPQGAVTVGHIYELMPFENELTVVPIAGAAVRQLCTYAQTYTNVATAGLTWAQDSAGHVVDVRIQGQPLHESRVYQLAINDYLANGGDGMTFLRNLPQRPLNRTIRQALLDFLRRERVVTVPPR